MGVITESAIRELAGFRGDQAPVTSCYLDVDGRRLSRHQDYEHELERIMRSARASGRLTDSVEADLVRIDEYVRGGFDRSSTRGLAMFSCAASDFWQVIPLPVPVRSRIVINESAAVAQLESIAHEFERFGVLLVDKQQARLLVFEFGELLEHSELFDELPRDYDTRGHNDQGDVTSHVAELAAVHVRHAAAVAFHKFQQEPFQHLTIGAPSALAGAVEHALHPYLQERLVSRIDVGVHASLSEIREATLDVERLVERQRESAAVERLRDHQATAQRAVVGLAPTLTALFERRVEQLLVSAGFTESGWHCLTCSHLGLVGRTCPSCGAELVAVPDIVEQAVDTALGQSCHVEICTDNADLDVLGRIGAILRY